MQNDRSLRIRTEIGETAPSVITVSLGQTYDTLEILSLKLKQENVYKLFNADYGVVVGRVLATGNFGVPNAKVSIFIPVENGEDTIRKILYSYKTVASTDNDGIRYNLLPDEAINACYQTVGTFPNKRFVLDNSDVIETFDKYWKYTTVTNAAGDYMLFGIPTGQQTIHVDIDLSDIGVLSQRPRDMMYQGFNLEQFDSPNKFKQSTDLGTLAQIKSQDKGVFVYPYWGDTTTGSSDTIGITRCDIQIQYNFQPTCIFLGSIISDGGSNAITKNCSGSKKVGNMSELVTGEGTIEMIRKTNDGKIEEFQIQGNRLIDGDGVWCYQIPMNLDYVTMDEFGNTVPTDDPTKGIPTRARVRFRISMDETPNDMPAKKRARFLVPNNPRIGSDYPVFSSKVTKLGNDAIDYEFGSRTLDEDFRDLMWNNVYTVKSYIPRIQSSKRGMNLHNTAIKKVNFSGANNPLPYNNLRLKLGLQYNIMCIIIKVFITLVGILNEVVMGVVGVLLSPYWKITSDNKLFKKIFGEDGIKIPNPLGMVIDTITGGLDLHCFPLNGRFCETEENTVYFPGCPGNLTDSTRTWVGRQNANNDYYSCKNRGDDDCKCEYGGKPYKQYKSESKIKLDADSTASFDIAELFNCVEQDLLSENESAAFNFSNDWINGVLYAPLWFRKVKPKKKFFFGLITRKAKDKYCSSDRDIPKRIKIVQSCATDRWEAVDAYGVGYSNDYPNEYGQKVIPFVYQPKGEPTRKEAAGRDCGSNCQKKSAYTARINKGIIKRKETLYSSDAYYYAPIEYSPSLRPNIYREKEYNSTVIGGDVILLYATDIVLLGSLNDCDRFGVPQFFKVLEPTTYQLPPDLIIETEEQDYKYNPETGEMEPVTDDEKGEVGSGYSVTEVTGADWGNSNRDDQYYEQKWQWSGIIRYLKINSRDGGLFYGVNCTSVDTVSKTDINLLRLCELGVSLDETEEVENLEVEEKNNNKSIEEVQHYENLVADGYVSKDELFDMDSRAAFATMNYNNLRTVFDETEGIYRYDFRYLYPENFDGAMARTMESYQEKMKTFKPRNGEPVSYRFNYLLEKFSRDYYRFRMGKAPYFYDGEFYDAPHKLPRYENSYYFYFGLTHGKTAIEKFNSKYFSTCENNVEPVFTFNYDFDPNTWCGNKSVDTMDGYFALDGTNIEKPYSIYMKNRFDDKYEFEILNSEDDMIYIAGKECPNNDIERLEKEGYIKYDSPECGMGNGTYDLQIVDAYGNIVNDTVKFNPPYLTFNLDDSVDFTQAFNKIYEDNDRSYEKVANNDINEAGEPDTVDKRVIGGLIVLNDVVNYNAKVPNDVQNWYDFKVKITSTTIFKEFDNKPWTLEMIYTTITHANKGGKSTDYNEGVGICISVPKADEVYTVEVIELCGGKESDNIAVNTVKIGAPQDLKLYINEVDYDLISGHKYDADGNIEVEHYYDDIWAVDEDEKTVGDGWFDMSNEENYNWTAVKKYNTMSDYEQEEYRNEVITNMINGFTFTSYDNKELKLRVVAADEEKPVYYGIVGREEESKETGEDSPETVYYPKSKELEKWVDTDEVVVGEPTITVAENKYWCIKDDNGEIVNPLDGHDGACWANCPDNLDVIKGIYYVGIKTIANSEIPQMKDENGTYHIDYMDIRSGKLVISDDALPLLKHIAFIDKIFLTDVIAWAYVKNMPYHGTDNDKDGKKLLNKFITYDGYVASSLVNGNATEDTEDTKRRLFATQKLGESDLIIKYANPTPEGNEKNYPVKSYIDGTDDKKYKGVIVYENDDDEAQYTLLPDRDVSLQITDASGSGLDVIVLGSMELGLLGTSYHDGDERELDFTINSTAADVRYYLFEYGDDENLTHPYEQLMSGEEEMKIEMKEWDEQKGVNMLSYQTKERTLKKLSQTNDNWEAYFTDRYTINGEGEVVFVPDGWEKWNDKADYNTSGKFKTDSSEAKQVLAIAVTENGTRAMSPIYDFNPITIDAFLLDSIEDNASNGSTSVGEGDKKQTGSVNLTTLTHSYRLGFRVHHDEENDTPAPYYPLHYDYDIEGTFIISGVRQSAPKITAKCLLSEVTEEGEATLGDFLVINADKSMFVSLGFKYSDSNETQVLEDKKPIQSVIDLENSEVYVTDVTGLKHKCKINDKITWQSISSTEPNNNTPEGEGGNIGDVPTEDVGGNTGGGSTPEIEGDNGGSDDMGD